jgi:O-antigen/teichoic acid export membrane protein
VRARFQGSIGAAAMTELVDATLSPRPHVAARADAPSTSTEKRPPARLVARLGRATTVMIALTFIASATNYASNIIFSRLLSPASYGDLTALIAFAVIVAVPTGAAQTVVAERVAVLLAEGKHDHARYLIRHALAHIAMIALILGVAYVLCIPLLKQVLGLQTIGPAIALAPLLVLSFFVPVAYGVLQGMERFVALGAVLLVTAMSRIVIGVPWTLAGGGAGGPLFGQAVGCLLALGATAYLARSYLLRRGTGAARAGLRRRPDRRTLAAGGVFIGFALISNLDVLLAKLLLPPHAAGEYAALVTVEKIVIFLPAAVAVVMVPNAARAMHLEGSARRVLRIAALLVALTTLLVAVPASLAPHMLLQLMFGPKYVNAAAGVLPIVCAGTGLALLYLLVVYTVAIEDRRLLWLLVGGVVVQVGAIVALHSSPAQIATVQACVIAILLVANECVFHPILRRPAAHRSHAPTAEVDGCVAR